MDSRIYSQNLSHPCLSLGHPTPPIHGAEPRFPGWMEDFKDRRELGLNSRIPEPGNAELCFSRSWEDWDGKANWSCPRSVAPGLVPAGEAGGGKWELGFPADSRFSMEKAAAAPGPSLPKPFPSSLPAPRAPRFSIGNFVPEPSVRSRFYGIAQSRGCSSGFGKGEFPFLSFHLIVI